MYLVTLELSNLSLSVFDRPFLVLYKTIVISARLPSRRSIFTGIEDYQIKAKLAKLFLFWSLIPTNPETKDLHNTTSYLQKK